MHLRRCNRIATGRRVTFTHVRKRNQTPHDMLRITQTTILHIRFVIATIKSLVGTYLNTKAIVQLLNREVLAQAAAAIAHEFVCDGIFTSSEG